MALLTVGGVGRPSAEMHRRGYATGDLVATRCNYGANLTPIMRRNGVVMGAISAPSVHFVATVFTGR